MRRSVLFCCFAVVAFTGAASAATHCCAHRGDLKNAPENTVPAFESAVRKGAHQIEFDVQRTADGALIIMHDGTVDRTTDGSGRVSDMTFAEIRGLDAGSWFAPEFAGTRVPTLEETLAVIPREILCNVHLKGDAALGAQVALALAALDRLDHCFLACTLEQAHEARTAVPDIMICNMSRQGANRSLYVSETIAFGAEFIQLVYLLGTDTMPEAVATLHEHGIKVNCFGASEEEPIRELIAAGVDYILTDDLDLCLKIASEHGVKPLSIPLAALPADK